jgi:hypothetical protein
MWASRVAVWGAQRGLNVQDKVACEDVAGGARGASIRVLVNLSSGRKK